MIFFFWDVWQNSGKSFVGSVGGNMATAATVPFYSCLHREVYVKAGQPARCLGQKIVPLALHKGV